MSVTEIGELTGEVRKRLEDLVKIRAGVSDAIKDSEVYKDELGKEIKGIVERVANDPKEGIRIRAGTGGLVRMEQKKTKTLSKEKLLELGVSADIIQQAIIETVGEPFMRIR